VPELFSVVLFTWFTIAYFGLGWGWAYLTDVNDYILKVDIDMMTGILWHRGEFYNQISKDNLGHREYIYTNYSLCLGQVVNL